MYDADKILTNFGPALARLRTKKDITQAELGEIAGVSAPPVSYWETGKRFPTVYSFIGICNALGISADERLKECEKG